MQLLKEFAQQQVESSAGFIQHLWACASLLRRLLDHIRHSFQGRYLVNYFFEQQVSLANPTLSISVAATAPIGYRIQVLEVIGAVKHMTNLACVPLKQARMDSTKVTNYKLNSNTHMVWAKKTLPVKQ